MSLSLAPDALIILALTVIAGTASLIAFIHAAVQRSDAFPAVGKQTKLLWVGILAVATLVIWLSSVVGFLGLIGVVATLVYLVDVRPRVDEIQGKSWFVKRR